MKIRYEQLAGKFVLLLRGCLLCFSTSFWVLRAQESWLLLKIIYSEDTNSTFQKYKNLNNGLFGLRYLNVGLNRVPFNDQTPFDRLNTQLQWRLKIGTHKAESHSKSELF